MRRQDQAARGAVIPYHWRKRQADQSETNRRAAEATHRLGCWEHLGMEAVAAVAVAAARCRQARPMWDR